MDHEPAELHLTAELEPTRVGPLRRALRWVVALIEAALGGGADAPDVDLVVRRISTGAEVLRTHADMGAPAVLLTRVRDDLATKSVTEFIAEWRLIDPPRAE